MRGYLRTEGGRKRLRIVKPGYDANDPAVPFDAVLFDSDSDGMGALLDSGVWKMPPNSNYSAATPGAWIKTWSYPFVPLCIFFSGVTATGPWLPDVPLFGGFRDYDKPQIRVSTSGIWIRGHYSAAAGGNLYIRWLALRIPAT